jgi:hypothetical protein
MMDFFVPELVNLVMAERLKDAGSIRVSRELGGGAGRERVRPRLAGIMGMLAASIHPEAARPAVGLRRVPHLEEFGGGAECGATLCLCEE